MQVTVCAELENRIRLSLCTLHRDQFNIQDALSSKSWESSHFIKIGQFLPEPNNGLPNFTFLRQPQNPLRSEEHTSELQSRPHLVCRLLLEKKKFFTEGNTW